MKDRGRRVEVDALSGWLFRCSILHPLSSILYPLSSSGLVHPSSSESFILFVLCGRRLIQLLVKKFQFFLAGSQLLAGAQKFLVLHLQFLEEIGRREFGQLLHGPCHIRQSSGGRFMGEADHQTKWAASIATQMVMRPQIVRLAKARREESCSSPEIGCRLASCRGR